MEKNWDYDEQVQLFKDSMEFDFSNQRSQKRDNYLRDLGIKGHIQSSYEHQREEGFNESSIRQIVKSQYDFKEELKNFIDIEEPSSEKEKLLTKEDLDELKRK